MSAPSSESAMRIERLRDAAMANAYYLRSSYLRNTAMHAAQSGRDLPDAKSRIADATLLLERAIKFDNNSPYLWWEFAALNNGLGNMAKVVTAYERLATLDPSPGLIAKLGSLYELRGQPDRAVAVYFSLLKSDPTNSLVRERIVDVYVEQGLRAKSNGDGELAQEQFRRALDELALLMPSNALARLQLKQALLCELLGNDDGAITAYQAAVRIDPDDEEPRIRISRIYFARGERAERTGRAEAATNAYRLAAQSLAQSVSAKRSKPELLNFAAYVYAVANTDLDFAESLVRAAIAQDDGNGAYIDTLGWICFRKGSFDEALKNALRAKEIEGDDPVIADHLGEIYLKLGQPDKAREMWEQSLRLDADNKLVRDKLDSFVKPTH